MCKKYLTKTFPLLLLDAAWYHRQFLTICNVQFGCKTFACCFNDCKDLCCGNKNVIEINLYNDWEKHTDIATANWNWIGEKEKGNSLAAPNHKFLSRDKKHSFHASNHMLMLEHLPFADFSYLELRKWVKSSLFSGWILCFIFNYTAISKETFK